MWVIIFLVLLSEVVLLSAVGPGFSTLLLFVTSLNALGLLSAKSKLPLFWIHPRTSKREPN